MKCCGDPLRRSPFAMRGVIIATVRDDMIAEARLYMEPVDSSGDHIDAAMEQQLLRRPAAPSG